MANTLSFTITGANDGIDEPYYTDGTDTITVSGNTSGFNDEVSLDPYTIDDAVTMSGANSSFYASDEGGDEVTMSGANATVAYGVGPSPAGTVIDGDDDILLSGANANVNVDTDNGGNTVDASNASVGGDHITVYGEDAAGLLGGDTVFGSAGNDVIISHSISGAGIAGNVLYGDAGDDTITAGQGLDTIYGGAGNDTIHGNTTAGTFISADAGNDLVNGLGSNDTVYGGTGDDTITGGAFVGEQLYGQAGNDTISLAAAGTIYGGAGNDALHDSDAAAHFISGDNGNDLITSTQGTGDTLYGGNGDDTIDGAGHTDHLYGQAGNDDITVGVSGAAELGAATVFGGQGDDVISVATPTGAPDDDTFHNYLSGDVGDDTITGGHAGDTFIGGTGADVLYGEGNGDDHFIFNSGDSTAGPSNATTTEGTGSDAGTSTTTGASGEANLDVIHGFTSGDILDFLGVTPVSGGLVPAAIYGPTGGASLIDPGETEAAAYQAAYTYAFGDGTSANPAHFAPGYEFAIIAAGNDTFIFSHEGDAVELANVSLTSNAELGGLEDSAGTVSV